MYIKLKVVPGAKEDKVEKLKEDEYRIWVKAPAERGYANERMLELVRGLFPGAKVRLVSGHTSPSKIVSVG